MSEEFTVRKIAAQQTISVEVALDYGLITEEQAREQGWTPPAPIPWHRRARSEARWWWHQHWPRVHFGPCSHEGCE